MIYFIYVYHNKNMFWIVFVGVGPPAPVSAHFLFWEILHLNLMFENEFCLHERELPIWIFMDIEYPWVKVDFGCLCWSPFFNEYFEEIQVDVKDGFI